MTKGRAELPGRVVAEWKPFVPLKLIKSVFCSATTLPGSSALPFVISTEAQRSGEISVWMLFLGNVFRQSDAW
jgi:hypothetical protein